MKTTSAWNVLYGLWLMIFLAGITLFAAAYFELPLAVASLQTVALAVIFIVAAPVIFQMISNLATGGLGPDKDDLIDEKISWYTGRNVWLGLLMLFMLFFFFYFLLWGVPFLFFDLTTSETNGFYLKVLPFVVNLIPLWLILPFIYLTGFYGPFVIKIFIMDLKVHWPGELTGVSFDDIIGQDQAIKKIKTILEAHDKFEDFKKIGGKPRFNMIFTGPPGIGKTHTARAIAASQGKPFLEISPGIIYQTFIGVNIIAMWVVFIIAGLMSFLYGGCYIFFDEFENLARQRGSRPYQAMANDSFGRLTQWLTHYMPVPGGSFGVEGVTTLLLAKLSGVGVAPPFWYKTSRLFFNSILDAIYVATFGFLFPPRVRTNVLNGLLNFLHIPKKIRFPEYIPLRLPPGRFRHVKEVYIGATNMPEVLDSAIKDRPERFQFIEFENPGIEERLAFVRYQLDRKKIPHHPDLDKPEARQEIVRLSEGFSFDQMEQLFQSSLQERFVKASGEEKEIAPENVAITLEDINEARSTLKYGFAKPTRMTRAATLQTGYHESGHFVAHKCFVGQERVPMNFSAIARGKSLGRLELGDTRPEDPHRQPFYEDNLRVALAAHVTEREFFDYNTAGVIEDLNAATVFACRMVSLWKMWPFRDEDETDKDWEEYRKRGAILLSFGTTPESHEMIKETISVPALQEAIEVQLGKAYVDAYRCIMNNKEAVEECVMALKDHNWEMVGDALKEFYLQLELNPISKSDPWPPMYIPSPYYREKKKEGAGQ